jgi:hypothetical protein
VSDQASGTSASEASYLYQRSHQRPHPQRRQVLKGSGSLRLPLLVLHILGGSVGLLSGTAAVVVRKGSALHRSFGNVFTIAMLTLASSGLCLAIMKSQTANIIGSFITFYLITTAWLVGRRRDTGWLDWAALLVGLGGAIGVLSLSVHTVLNPATADKSAPSGMGFFFGAILLLAAAGDIQMLVRRGIYGRQRVTRHLWRMCFGLFIATGSFFLGQQQVFPAFLRGSVFLTVLALLPFPVMIYWLWRVRFGKAYRSQPVRARALGAL